MAATIKIKNSSTASAVPTSSDLVQGELAVNVTDKRIFTENASGTVVELGTNPSILTLPDGSASAPTLTNDGDTNTGIFFPAADTVGITTGGTERARVDSSGNLGLGVTPSAWSQGKSVETGFVGNSLWSPGGNEIIVSQGAYFNSGWKYSGSTAGAVSFYSQITGQHRWYNAPSGTAGNAITFTQAMTLDSSGNLLVGTTSGNVRLVVDGSTGAASFTGDDLNHYQATFNSKSASASTHYQIGFFKSTGTAVGAITHNDTSTTYATSSDYRLKENIAPMTGALSVVQQLKPCTYTWKENGAAGQGFIAHELQAVLPDAVVGEKDAVDTDGNPKYQGIDTSFLVATLTAAIQELKAEFDAYKASHP